MIEFLLGLSAGLVILLVARRQWTRAFEAQHSRLRAVEEEAEAQSRFAGGLLALVNLGRPPDDLAREITALVLTGVGATGGAFYSKRGDESLKRVAVVGLPPLQRGAGASYPNRAAEVAAIMGQETVAIGEGMVGEAARTRTTISRSTSQAASGGSGELAIPVLDGGELVGVFSISGPAAGGVFTADSIALAERLLSGAGSALGQASLTL